MTTTNWRKQAACVDEPDAMFPGTSTTDIEYAKDICHRCPVLDACAQWALDTRQEYGVWGGLSAGQRRSILRRKQRRNLTPDAVAAAAELARAPKREPRTLAGVLQAHTVENGEHLLWTGPAKIHLRGEFFTPKQAAYRIANGRRAVGQLRATCGIPACLRHIADSTERIVCGTRSGYQHHVRTKSAICDPCRKANSAAERMYAAGRTRAAA